jgi:hypothetical protein
MIEVECKCYYDLYKHAKWPTKMACRPMIRDTVEPLTGQEPLMISEVVHCERKNLPYVRIMLTTQNGVVPQ